MSVRAGVIKGAISFRNLGVIWSGPLALWTVSWSLKPGKGIHRSTSDGRLVQKMSSVLSVLVGKSTICSQPM